MEIRHYLTTNYLDQYLIKSKTKRTLSNDIKDIQITKDMITIITFDRIISEIEADGKRYPVATKKLNVKVYQVGKFVSLEALNLDPVTTAGFMAMGCKGKVISPTGIENFVFEGQEVVNIPEETKISTKNEAEDKNEIKNNNTSKSTNINESKQ